MVAGLSSSIEPLFCLFAANALVANSRASAGSSVLEIFEKFTCSFPFLSRVHRESFSFRQTLGGRQSYEPRARGSGDSSRATFCIERNLIPMRTEQSMEGKVVLVTGADGGLGKYVTQSFLNAGATVIGTSRKIQQSDFSSSSFTALPAEISSREDAHGLVDQVVARFSSLDVLAHTVGGFAGGRSIADTDDATFQRMFELNLNSL